MPRVCHALINTFSSEYLAVPTSEQEWLEIAKLYESRWNFPNCIGALDGKTSRYFVLNTQNQHIIIIKGSIASFLWL